MRRPKKIVEEVEKPEAKGGYNIRLLSSGKEFTAGSRSLEKALEDVLANNFQLKGFSELIFQNNLKTTSIKLAPMRFKRLKVNKILQQITIKHIKTIIG